MKSPCSCNFFGVEHNESNDPWSKFGSDVGPLARGLALAESMKYLSHADHRSCSVASVGVPIFGGNNNPSEKPVAVCHSLAFSTTGSSPLATWRRLEASSSSLTSISSKRQVDFTFSTIAQYLFDKLRIE